MDDQIIFPRLGHASIYRIVDIRLRDLQKMLNDHDRRIKLEVGEDAKIWLAQKGFNPVYGARALNRVITRSIRSPVSAALLKGTLYQVRGYIGLSSGLAVMACS